MAKDTFETSKSVDTPKKKKAWPRYLPAEKLVVESVNKILSGVWKWQIEEYKWYIRSWVIALIWVWDKKSVTDFLKALKKTKFDEIIWDLEKFSSEIIKILEMTPPGMPNRQNSQTFRQDLSVVSNKLDKVGLNLWSNWFFKRIWWLKRWWRGSYHSYRKW